MQLVRNPEQRHLFAGLPSFRHLLRRKQVERVPGTALSLRNRWEPNYYHATIECFSALAAYADAGLLDGNTLVIGNGLAQTSIWSDFVRRGGLGSTRFVVQGSAWVVGDGEVAFVDLPRTTGGHTAESGAVTITEVTPHRLRRTLSLLETVLPPRRAAPDLHLYVTRGVVQGRRLRNDAAVADLFRERGFEVVDPGSMSWTEQAALFRRAARVAGVHGAALTNVIYRWPESMQLLEFTEPGFLAPHYRNIARALDYEYAEITGARGEGDVRKQVFEVDLDAVAHLLDTWERRDSWS